MSNIYLIGFMGTGKSAVGKQLQKFLPFVFVDMDEAIARVECMSIPEIFEKKGEEGFRDAETALLKILSKQDNQIISCGGGVVLRDENIDIMRKTGTVVRLTSRPELVYERINRNNLRPLAKGKSLEEIKEMMDSREKQYQKAAHFTVESSEEPVDVVVSEIVRSLALADRLN
ncbi:MAG: shikimate kinase [Pseudobutyrivibrio sp.]|nr:shikimate kinase [Pseudobutyrivibrio sp.]